MDASNVLIVGGGPAGAACAGMLSAAGLRVTILDRQRFPRDKTCGGWITPDVLKVLEIDPKDYSPSRVMQPISGFRIACMGGRGVVIHYDGPVSYGIRRCEFDHYVLARSGARVVEATSLERLERSGKDWIANGRFKASLVVGAGGHFCPVARFLGARPGSEPSVVAQEIEFPMNEEQRAECAVRPEVPELYFSSDMKGYGWCFRKGNYLNVGLGRLDHHLLSHHVGNFIAHMEDSRRIPGELARSLHGHAYLLYGLSTRTVVDDGVMLVGDAAGLAYPQSGEGIRPAVESGLIAAEVILRAGGDYRRQKLAPYQDRLQQRFGRAGSEWARRLSMFIPGRATAFLARRLLATHWFSRRILIDRWFLHTND